MGKAIFCIAKDLEQTEIIIDRLRVAGFSKDDISVLFPDRTGTRDFAHEKGTKAPEGAVTGISTGGVLGGTLGYLAGIGAIAIPGIGPLIAAGPIMATLSGIAVGGAVGGVTGALVGMGIPEYEAKRYAGKVKDGNILISAHTDDKDQVSVAKAVFKNANATDISTAGEEDADVDARDPRADEGRELGNSPGDRATHPEELPHPDERRRGDRRLGGDPPPTGSV